MAKVMWDLCSGLGGWTKAFYETEDWDIYSFEINKQLIEDVGNKDFELFVDNKLYLTQIEDVTKWEEWHSEYPKPDLITASPPCTEFSTAYNAPRSEAERQGNTWEPDMSVSLACKEIIDYMKPQYWICENVYGSARYLEPVFGPTRQAIRPWLFYGRFPPLHLPVGYDYSKRSKDVSSCHPYRANVRAVIPYEVSLALKQSVEDQRTLKEWY